VGGVWACYASWSPVLKQCGFKSYNAEAEKDEL